LRGPSGLRDADRGGGTGLHDTGLWPVIYALFAQIEILCVDKYGRAIELR